MPSVKEYIILGLFFTFMNSAIDCQSWQNKWFSMNIPDNWRVPDRDYGNFPPLRYRNSGIKVYKDVRFTPSSGIVSGNFVIETYVDDRDRLDYKDFLRKDSITLKNESINLNGMTCLKRTAVLQIHDKEKILPFYCTIWYVQGKLRVYIISFGSYNKTIYENNLGSAEKCITSFKEK